MTNLFWRQAENVSERSHRESTYFCQKFSPRFHLCRNRIKGGFAQQMVRYYKMTFVFRLKHIFAFLKPKEKKRKLKQNTY